MNRKIDSTRSLVNSIFRQLCIPDVVKPDQFWKRLEKKHGQAARLFGNAVQQRSAGYLNIDPYSLKNASESLSLDITGQYESKFYRDFIEWLANENIAAPARILDLGSGNGVLTVLLAALFPSAKIVAIDSNAAGVEIGRSIASRLNLSQIEWIVGDPSESNHACSGRKFDLIIASKFFHEFLETPPRTAVTGHSIRTFGTLKPVEQNISKVRCISTLMESDATLIALDRWASVEYFGWWVRVAEAAGLRISLNKSFLLKTAESGVTEVFTISVFGTADSLPVQSDEQLLGFFTYQELGYLFEKLGPIEGAPAEAIFLSFGGRQLIAEFAATYRNGSGSQETKVFIAGCVAGLYITWSTGLRKLYLAPAVAIGSILGRLNEMMADLESHCEIVLSCI